MNNVKNVIEMKHVRKTYQRGSEKIHALDDVSLEVKERELLAVVGPSGSGKTTLLEVAGCMEAPTSGDVVLNSHNVTRLSDRELTGLRSRYIGFVFQQFFLLPTLTAIENVELPALFAKNNQRGKRAEELLQLVGLENRADHLPSQLSGGQMQRVAIARALVNNPKILLADEPTGNLDSKTARSIFEVLKKLTQSGLTVIIVTHNSDLAGLCGRIVTLRDGKLV